MQWGAPLLTLLLAQSQRHWRDDCVCEGIAGLSRLFMQSVLRRRWSNMFL